MAYRMNGREVTDPINPEVRQAVVEFMVEVLGPKAARPLLDIFRKELDRGVLLTLILEAQQLHLRAAIPILEQLRLSPDEEVRINCSNALEILRK